MLRTLEHGKHLRMHARKVCVSSLSYIDLVFPFVFSRRFGVTTEDTQALTSQEDPEFLYTVVDLSFSNFIAPFLVGLPLRVLLVVLLEFLCIVTASISQKSLGPRRQLLDPTTSPNAACKYR